MRKNSNESKKSGQVIQKNSIKFLMSTTAFIAGAMLMPSHADAQVATPTNSWDYDTILDGNVGKDTTVAGITDISVVGGNGFVEGNADIYTGHTVNVVGDGGATFAYRDNRANIESTLNGDLNSNMKIVIIDKDGLFFGDGSVIDVQSLVATTSDVSIDDVMNGAELTLSNVGGDGSVIINGSVTVAEAGLAAFVSPFITNNAVINAKMGNVVMAAGETVTLDLYGDGLVEVVVDGELADALIENKNEILAEGGNVQITARAAKDTIDNIVNNEGIISVASATVQGGKIILSGGIQGTVANSGTLDASGTDGGSIDVTGQNVEIAETAEILVDGNGAPELLEAELALAAIEPASGNGGDVYINGEDTTSYQGHISSTSTGAGTGGTVEVSGGELTLGGTIDVSAGGNVVFDPVTFTIEAAEAATIVSALSGGADVDVAAEETITLNAEIDSSTQVNTATLNFADEDANSDLTVNLNEDISLGASQTLTGEATVVNVIEVAEIQDGIDVSASGATVNVADGTYNENLVVNKSLSLIGDAGDVNVPGAASATLQGDGSGVGVLVSSGATDVTISGFEIDNYDAAIHADIASGQVVTGTEIDINNNTITNVNRGMFIDEFADINVAFNTIDVTGSGDAVFIEDFSATTANVTDNVITGNGTGDDGIEINDFFLNDGMTANIERNTISGFTGAGVDVDDPATVSISENVITGNGVGVEIDSDSDASRVTVFNNDLSGNTLAVDNQDVDAIVDASGNWFGSTDEATVLASNIGLVDVTPYLNSGADTDAGTLGFQGDFSDITVTTLGEQVQTDGRINEGVDLVTVGGTVNVNAGTYNEAVIVDKAVTLLGANNGIAGYGARGAESIVIPNSPGFSVTADNVTIDGFTVLGGDPSILASGADNVSILNNVISGSTTHGVQILNSDKAIVQGNDIYDVASDGIHVVGSGQATVLSNRVSMAGDDGIEVYNSDGTVNVSGNRVEDVVGHGIWANDPLTGSGFVITANDVMETGLDGIRVEENAVNVSANRVDFTGGHGIVADMAKDNALFNANSIGLNGTSVGDIGGHGLIVTNSLASQITNGEVMYTAQDGIHVDNNDGVLIDGNDIFDTGNDGIELRNLSGFTVTRNDIDNSTTGREGIVATSVSSGLIYDNTINAYSDGVRLGTASFVTITGNDIDTNHDEGVELDNSDNIVISGNDIHDVGDQGIELDNSTFVLIDGNTISDTDDEGIELDNSSLITITDNTITGSGDEGIEADNVDGLTVEDNRITDSGDEGISVYNGTETIIHENVVTNSGLDGTYDGIFVGNTDDVELTKNIVTTTTEDGIHVSNSNGATVKNNIVSDVAANGIHINPSDDVEIVHNTIFDAALDGIHVDQGARALIKDNHVANVGDDGIDVVSNLDVKIINNTVHHTGESDSDGNGIEVSDSANAKIAKNEVHHTGDDGIDVESSANAKILKNKVHHTRDDGIDVEGSDNALIKKNRVHHTGDDGIEVVGGNNIRILENKIRHTEDDGIDVEETSTANIRDNEISYIGDDGIDADNFGSLWIAYNDISDVENDGIDVHGGEFVSIYDNWITRVGEDGIHVGEVGGIPDRPAFGDGFGYSYHGSDVDIYGNIVSFAREDGIHVHDAHSTYISDNVVGHVFDDGIDVHNTTLSYIVDNAVSMTGDNGIGVDGGAYAGIFGNKVLLTGDEGIDVDNINWFWDGPLDVLGTVDYGHGWAVNIARNDVAFTGNTGIEVENSNSTRVSHNDVLYAGLGEGLGEMINFVNELAFRSYEGGGQTMEVIPEAIVEDYMPSFSWSWGDGDGINVSNVYGYSPHGLSVKIDHNKVAFTGGDGIEVNGAGSTLIKRNNVKYAGIDETQWYGYHHMGQLVDEGPFAAQERETLWHGENMNDLLRSYLPRPDYIGWDNHDGIHVENVHGRRVIPVGLPGEKTNGGEYHRQDYDLVITKNTVRKTGDDGIDVNGAGRTLIGWNRIRNAGYGDGYSYGGDKPGADGIHVRDVYGFGGFPGLSENGYGGYAVNIIGNKIKTTGDDGIAVVDSGSAYIANNRIRNAGYGRGGGYGSRTRFGSDGIIVRNVYGEGRGPAGIEGVDYAVVIEGNKINTTGDDGIEVRNAGRTLIDDNRIRNAGYGGGSDYEGSDYYGADGIHVYNVHAPELNDYPKAIEGELDYSNLGYSVIITNNVIDTTGDDGIEVLHSGSTKIDNNEVYDAGDDGIRVETGFYGPMKPTLLLDQGSFEKDIYFHPTNIVISNNTVDNAGGDGVEVVGSNIDLLVDTNEITNSGDNGILLVAQGGFYLPRGEDVVSPVFLQPPGPGGEFNSRIVNNTVENSGSHGLYVQGGGHNDVILEGNTFIDNPTGARFESGDIDLTNTGNPNFFIVNSDFETEEGPVVGLQFDDYFGFYPDILEGPSFSPIIFGNGLSIVGETLGTTQFSGFINRSVGDAFYVRIEDGTLLDPDTGAPIVIDGTFANWDGLVPNAFGNVLPASVLQALEDRIFDADDPALNGRGQIFVGVEAFSIDNIQDFFKDFESGAGGASAARLTVLGLPSIGSFGASGLAGISPAAGEEGETDEDLADISPAAGGDEQETQEVTCWDDAVDTLDNTGAAINFSFGGTFEDSIAGQSACSTAGL